MRWSAAVFATFFARSLAYAANCGDLPAATTVALGPFSSIAAMCPVLRKREQRYDFFIGGDGPSCPECRFTCRSLDLAHVRDVVPWSSTEVVLFVSTSRALTNGYNHGSEAYAREQFLNVPVQRSDGWYLLANVDRGLDGNHRAIRLVETSRSATGCAEEPVLVVRERVDRAVNNVISEDIESVFAVRVAGAGPPELISPEWLTRLEAYRPFGGQADHSAVHKRRWQFQNGQIVPLSISR